LELKSSKSSQIFNTKHHKIARKSTHYFLSSFKVQKSSQKYQEIYMKFLELLKDFLGTRIYKTSQILAKIVNNYQEITTYFLIRI
jgi:hypothetical protein